MWCECPTARPSRPTSTTRPILAPAAAPRGASPSCSRSLLTGSAPPSRRDRPAPGSAARAIAPCAAGIDLYRDLAFGGGIPNMQFAATWLALRGTMVVSQPTDATGPRSPAGRAARLAGLDAGMYTEVSLGGARAFDGAFWRQRAPATYLARVVRNGVPALLLSGWFDVYQRGVVLDYSALQNAYAASRRGRRRPALFGPMPGDARPTGRYQAVIGPWFHNSTGHGERVQLLLLRWFDRWL